MVQLISQWASDKEPGTIVYLDGKQFYYISTNHNGSVKVIDAEPITKAFDTRNRGYFLPKDVSNVGYYLNNTYLNNLHQTIKEMIVENTTWFNGEQDNETEIPVTVTVGLLTKSEFENALSVRGGLLPHITTNREWTMTRVKSYGDKVWGVNTNGATNDNFAANNEYMVRPAMFLKSDLMIDENSNVLANTTPITVVNTPTQNQTLYENDIINIAGNASDADVGNSVTVRYQVNASTPRAIKAFISTGATESFGKNLTFRAGSLYDSDTLIASGLVDGVPHTLKVWATDDNGGTSTIIERTFYVVPNRAPSLTVNPPVIAGNIDSDVITIDGAWNDADGNNATVAYRINGGNSVQVAQGVSGNFDFDITFGQLKDGVNNIAVEVTDSYGAKTTRTVRLNKTAVAVPQLRSTARYKIEPPTGSAKSVLLWVTRSQNLTIDVALSMTMQGEAENFVPVAASNSAPNTAVAADAIEDEFYREVDTPVDNIVLQIDMTRASEQDNAVIYLLQGVLE